MALDAHDARSTSSTGPFDFALVTLKAPASPTSLPALQERDLVDVFVRSATGSCSSAWRRSSAPTG